MSRRDSAEQVLNMDVWGATPEDEISHRITRFSAEQFRDMLIGLLREENWGSLDLVLSNYNIPKPVAVMVFTHIADNIAWGTDRVAVPQSLTNLLFKNFQDLESNLLNDVLVPVLASFYIGLGDDLDTRKLDRFYARRIVHTEALPFYLAGIVEGSKPGHDAITPLTVLGLYKGGMVSQFSVFEYLYRVTGQFQSSYWISVNPSSIERSLPRLQRVHEGEGTWGVKAGELRVLKKIIKEFDREGEDLDMESIRSYNLLQENPAEFFEIRDRQNVPYQMRKRSRRDVGGA